MAYPSFIAASAIVSAPGYSNPAKTVPWPDGVQDGDLVVLIGMIENGTYTVNVSGGFTLLQRHGVSGFRCELYTATKIFRTGDVAPTVHPGQTFSSRWRCVAFRGVDQVASVESSRNAFGTEPDNTINIPANTSTIGEVLHVVIAAQLDIQTTNLTANNPLIEIAATDGSAFGFVAAAANGPATAGSVSAKTITTSRANTHGYIDFLVRPASVSPPQTPQGTTTIGTISSVTASAASVPFTYSASDQTGFEYRLGGAGTPVSIAASPIALSGLTASTTYTIEVRAVNATGAGAWSSPVQFTTSAAQVPQGTVTVGTVASVTHNSASVPFTYSASDQTGFQYSLNGTSNPVTVPGGTSPIALSGLAASTAYTVYVRAVNATGNGAWSAPRNFTTAATPQVPQGTFTIGSITVGQTTASVPYSYSASDQTAIQYRLGGTGTPQTASASPLALSGLNAGTQYSIQFRAVNASGPQLNWSTAVSFTTSSVPGPIATFTTGALTDLNGVLQANKNLLYLAAYNKTTGQLVVRKTTGLTTDTNGRCTISDAALTQGQEYRWDWETVDGHRCMPLGTAQ